MLNELPLIMLENALSVMEDGFMNIPPFDSCYSRKDMEAVMVEVARKMQENYPYFHPLYAGQMLKSPHPIAQAAYMLSMWINPNNHALDGGIASSQMEKEAVAEIAGMFGWDVFLGHLTSGGTMANLEALWISGQLKPGKLVVASEQAHYTHSRISKVLGLEFISIPCDDEGRLDIYSLESSLKEGEVGTVVATIGTTGLGAVDPIPELLELRDIYGFRLHADAAYGGYFILVDNLDAEVRTAFQKLPEVDSIVVDPHKHGLQPYGCGSVLFKAPEVGCFYKHDSPYTYFTSEELHLGEISLECSRAGASAVGLWATQKLLPLEPGGEFAKGLSRSREAAIALYNKLEASPGYRTILFPSLDILVWAPEGRTASQISERTEQVFSSAAEKNLHLAKIRLPLSLLQSRWTGVHFDQDDVTCLRSCLMKPEHLDWVGEIMDLLNQL